MWKYSLFFALKIIVLSILATSVAYLIFIEQHAYAFAVFLVLIWLWYFLFSYKKRVIAHVQDFSQAIRYRDFTRRYPSKGGSIAEKIVFQSFNEINDAFYKINSEKEIQHEYLNKVINMLDMALVFYQADTGKVVWINEAFKELFGTPHIVELKGLAKRLPDLYAHTIALQSGQQRMELTQSTRGKIKLLIQASAFETKDGNFRIVSYQNVNETIDQTETQAWHKLLRVLTHEIMNSIGPITSLADTLHAKLEDAASDAQIEDVKLGIDIIRSRSQGLLQFAKSYRLINQVDQPNFAEISVLQLFENLHQLLAPTLLQKNIELETVIKNTRLQLLIDQNLIEQVLINVILNARDALAGVSDPQLSMQALVQHGKVQIRVKDNGVGIPQGLADQIFTPFFTTKKTGSGIGLTLSKQIMLLHGGNIFIESQEGQGTTVVLQF